MFAFLLLIANVALLGLASQRAQAGVPPSQVVLCVLVAFVPNGLLLCARLPAGLTRHARIAPVLVSLLAGLILLPSPPVLSDDVYRFVWDARQWLSGESPYRYAPADPALVPLRDALYARINFPHIATIYPPLAQVLFAPSALFAAGVLGAKAVALLGHLLLVWMLSRGALGLASVPHEQRLRVCLCYALNPLALMECAGSGHMDAWVGLLVLVCAQQLAHGRVVLAGFWAGAVSGIKLLGLPLVPLFLSGPLRMLWGWAGEGQRRPRAKDFAPAALVLTLSALFLWPMVGAGGDKHPSGLSQYGQHWRGNEGGFAALAFISRPLVLGLDGLDGQHTTHGEVSLLALRPVLGWLEAVGVSPRYQPTPRHAPRALGHYPVDYAAGILARIIAGFLVLGLAGYLGRNAPSAEHLRAVLLCLLLLSPQVHPWYLLWLLPLDVALGRRVVWVWSASVLGSYAPLDGWVSMRVWLQPVGMQWAQYGLVALAWGLEYRAPNGARVDPREVAA